MKTTRIFAYHTNKVIHSNDFTGSVYSFNPFATFKDINLLEKNKFQYGIIIVQSTKGSSDTRNITMMIQDEDIN